ncbi:hypothetical protein CAEBREN_15844 [Caenorhabditis brenneri]|uniref:HMG box domain-containing protein n=1 Tax=Caenorhabditis brenneri TaxID=135651 RepID=G0MJ92_CAEBE|nr:hypothetical protein CAEBREN_15844 [Caenorhabditis brenneri]
MKTTQIQKPSIFDEFQRYHIPNVFVHWYDLEPTFGVYNASKNETGGKWLGATPTTHHQQHIQEEQKKRKIRSTSAYALFFREQQNLEKKMNPTANFGQISQNIARQWELLSDVEKKAYKTRCEKNRKTSIANAVMQKAHQLMMTSKSSSFSN